MDPKKLSVVLPLAITTAIFFTGAIALEGVTLHSTHSLNIKNLQTRSQFNDFLESETAKIERQKYPESFYAVSEFVKNNGRGTLVAIEESSEKDCFKFKYYKNNTEKETLETQKSKTKILKNWSAVERYLKNVCSDNPITITATNGTNMQEGADKGHNFGKKGIDNDESVETLQNLDKKLRQAKKRSDEAAQRYYKLFPPCSNSEPSLYHPLFNRLTQNEQEKIKAKRREYLKALENWILVNPPYSTPPNILTIKKAEILMYETSAEYYAMQVKLYENISNPA